MFAISRGVKLNNFETCLLSVVFTISKVHEFIIQPSYIPSINFNVNNRKFITKWHKGNKKQKHSKHNYLLKIRNGEINNKADSYKANVED